MTSFFRPVIEIKEKPVSYHPWEKVIKDIYNSTYKYGHNSAKNLIYPKIKEEVPSPNRVKFTIIGDRVVKEFIHSINLVKGLHDYRPKEFDSPVIRGVDSVEWHKVWHDLKIQYGGLAYCLSSPVAVLVGEKFLGGYKELKELIDTKYIYHLTFNYYKEGVAQFASYIKSSGRPCVYMHISVDDKQIGTLLFMLYADIAPMTCENFLNLCKTKRGGYSGTPIHRIVKDCWIQCGGYGLKNSNLDCENFIVAHDRRGVLCMANDGRHADCSTQFFVLLQPAPWMAFKYVAFGQLIDGEETLKKIERIPTYYEAPTSNITIFKAGIFNMECHDFMINRGANAYIDGHIEDLNILGPLLYEELIQKVFMVIEFRMLALLNEQVEEEEIHGETHGEGMDEEAKSIRTTKRFMRKKEEIQQQLAPQSAKPSSPDTKRGTSTVSQSKSENNEFDVDEYHYEPEEYSYPHVTPKVSEMAMPAKPFYIPLTDVPYPGEVDSTYDLKKFLRGDYCLESDLRTHGPKKKGELMEYPSDVFYFDDGAEESDGEDSDSLDSDDAREVGLYIQNNADHVSFAGETIKNIAKTVAHVKLFEKARRFKCINDETLRRLRLVTADYQHRRDKKVSLSIRDSDKKAHLKIKRRQTGFVRPEDLEQIRVIHKTDSEHMQEDEEEAAATRKVRITESGVSKREIHSTRRPTAFPRGVSMADDTESTMVRPSVLTRLYDDVHYDDDDGPTLKDYKPMAETHTKNSMFLTSSPQDQIKSALSTRDRESKFFRPSIGVENDSINHVLNIQHGKKTARKISSDYVKTIDQIEQKARISLRSVEYARSRPALSVTEYQIKNQKYQDELKATAKFEGGLMASSSTRRGIRLPGDTPTISQASLI